MINRLSSTGSPFAFIV
jgi:hypothetical protein